MVSFWLHMATSRNKRLLPLLPSSFLRVTFFSFWTSYSSTFCTSQVDRSIQSAKEVSELKKQLWVGQYCFLSQPKRGSLSSGSSPKGARAEMGRGALSTSVYGNSQRPRTTQLLAWLDNGLERSCPRMERDPGTPHHAGPEKRTGGMLGRGAPPA